MADDMAQLIHYCWDLFLGYQDYYTESPHDLNLVLLCTPLATKDIVPYLKITGGADHN